MPGSDDITKPAAGGEGKGPDGLNGLSDAADKTSDTQNLTDQVKGEIQKGDIKDTAEKVTGMVRTCSSLFWFGWVMRMGLGMGMGMGNG